jgi:hypothetical protein
VEAKIFETPPEGETMVITKVSRMRLAKRVAIAAVVVAIALAGAAAYHYFRPALFPPESPAPVSAPAQPVPQPNAVPTVHNITPEKSSKKEKSSTGKKKTQKKKTSRTRQQ